MKKVLLAYSGGLDTSYCIVYLSQDLGYEVHAVTVDTGGFSASELEQTGIRARQMGAASWKAVEVVPAYYRDCLRFLLFGNVLKNNTYPLSVSAERVFQAVAIARAARAIGAQAIAHGSTGAGNDQVRFDMIFQSLAPEAEIITPIRDQQLSREQEIAYLQAKGIAMDSSKAAYSINQGLWGTSVGGRETLGSRLPLPEEAWPVQATATRPQEITLTFTQGEPTALNGQEMTPVAVIRALETLAAPYGIGRDIHVGDTIIGIKGRVGFQAAAPLILIKAHELLEKHVLTKWQIYHKQQLALFYGNWLHEGQFLDPAMRDIEAFLLSSQQQVSGTVHVQLHPGRYQLLGIASPHDLMNSRFGAYGEMNTGWTGEDVRGFARIFGNQNRIFHAVNSNISHHD
ncbi:MAG: argininosuccinate synthase [Bacteroidetes bacterium]|nr:argininosuccinate synthase [Bacteroidota bacterium]